jgi:hypothetical protein
VAPTSTARSSSTAVLKSAPICAVSPPSFAVAASHGVICACASASKSAIDAALSSAPPLLLLLLLPLLPLEPADQDGKHKKSEKKTKSKREKKSFFLRFAFEVSGWCFRSNKRDSETATERDGRTDFALDRFEALDDELEPLDQLVQHGVGHFGCGTGVLLLCFSFLLENDQRDFRLIVLWFTRRCRSQTQILYAQCMCMCICIYICIPRQQPFQKKTKTVNFDSRSLLHSHLARLVTNCYVLRCWLLFASAPPFS